jgi:hypothetical protein
MTFNEHYSDDTVPLLNFDFTAVSSDRKTCGRRTQRPVD